MSEQIPEPGRERDEAIARAFGWTTREGPGVTLAGPTIHWVGPDGYLRFVRPWSTDDGAAIDVLHEMAERGYNWRAFTSTTGKHRYAVSIWPGHRLSQESQEHADSLADAITYAALRALEASNAD